MASFSGGHFPPNIHHGSSSSRSPPKRAAVEDDADNDDPVASSTRDRDIFADDPLGADDGNTVSFKRKQKQTTGSRFLSSLTTSRQATPSPRSGTPNLNNGRTSSVDINGGNMNGPLSSEAIKDGAPLDWYVEGPGRRVGYDNMTAIDWIFEYTKERQRLRMLYSSASGLVGYLQQALDASQIWVILISTGLLTGLVAAGIDVISVWLGDLKYGYCSAGDDSGRFYLNKAFCCLGYDELAQCQDWISWSNAVHISSAGGTWFIEYFFFVLFSVYTTFPSLMHPLTQRLRYRLLLEPVCWFRNMRYMRSIVVSPRSRLFSEVSFFAVLWELGLWW